MSGRCGALAIHFLHNVVHGAMLPISPSEAETVHATLRDKFAKAVALTEFVVRPWIWGSGDTEGDSPVSDPADMSSRECRPLPRLPTGVEGTFPMPQPSWECGPLPIMPVHASSDMSTDSPGWETISCVWASPLLPVKQMDVDHLTLASGLLDVVPFPSHRRFLSF